MIIEYEKEYLQELYDVGKCRNKNYRFQPQVVRKYQKRIDTLMAAIICVITDITNHYQ